MEAIFFPRLEKGTEIYTIDNYKIEKFFVEGAIFTDISGDVLGKDISFDIILSLEWYNDGVNSYSTTRRLSDCYFSKEDLIKNL